MTAIDMNQATVDALKRLHRVSLILLTELLFAIGLCMCVWLMYCYVPLPKFIPILLTGISIFIVFIVSMQHYQLTKRSTTYIITPPTMTPPHSLLFDVLLSHKDRTSIHRELTLHPTTTVKLTRLGVFSVFGKPYWMLYIDNHTGGRFAYVIDTPELRLSIVSMFKSLNFKH